MSSVQSIIKLLDLIPHPEGGYYAQTFCDKTSPDSRALSTAIYYLLPVGERSHWHRVDAAEVWHFYAGAPLSLSISADGHNSRAITLGNDLMAGQRPQAVVKKHEWQSAESLGAWSLVGCTVAPGFEFAGFEMAPTGWIPFPD